MFKLKEHRDENRKLHREDGPAFLWTDGSKEWYIHGKAHREDGPAEEWNDGSKSWWWEGEWIMESEGDVTEAQLKEFKLRVLI